MNKNIKICFMGTPHFGRVVLEKLNNEFDVVLVVTQTDSINKRGKILVPEVKTYALENGLSILQSEKIKNDLDKLKEYEFDFIVTAAYGQFLPQSIIDLPKYKILNVHGSYLPSYRGSSPIQRAILNDERFIGVSIIETVKKMDAGDIYDRIKIPMEDSFNTKLMMDKLSNIGADMVINVINKIYNNEPINVIKQNEDEVTIAPLIEKSEELLDFSENSRYLFNKIRAFYDDPATYFIKDDTLYKVFQSESVDYKGDEINGTILSNNKELLIKCGKGALSIKEIQPSGKKRMDILSFLNGYKDKFKIGDVIKCLYK